MVSIIHTKRTMAREGIRRARPESLCRPRPDAGVVDWAIRAASSAALQPCRRDHSTPRRNLLCKRDADDTFRCAAHSDGEGGFGEGRCKPMPSIKLSASTARMMPSIPARGFRPRHGRATATGEPCSTWRPTLVLSRSRRGPRLPDHDTLRSATSRQVPCFPPSGHTGIGHAAGGRSGIAETASLVVDVVSAPPGWAREMRWPSGTGADEVAWAETPVAEPV